MPVPNNSLVSQFSNLMLLRELQYDTISLTREHDANVLKLNEEQRVVYDKIIDCVSNKRHGFFFVYGFGGTGKTFLYRVLSARLRSEKKIVINVASSGITSLLLPGGKTAYSMFNIPIELTKDTVCRIKKDSAKAEVVRLADLIIWDEAPMTNKLAFEALDRTLRDIMVSVSDRNKDLPFGGKVVVLGGDFRQVLPVIPKGSRAEIVMASINSSILWKYCKVLRLTKNMRLTMGLEQSTPQELRSFSDWILQIGEGRCGTVVSDKIFVDIPSDLIIPVLENPVEDIDRAILAPTVDNVEEINNYIVDLLPGEEKNYLSTDSICGSDVYYDVDVDWINVEFLNQIRCSGLPNHSLKLKIGVPIILLRNIDPPGGLCNGTRLVVRDLGRNVISADIVSGSNVGDKVFITRMNMIPSDTVIPFKFQCRQFPISLSFAMTINKSQGQTLSTVGLFLHRPMFCHGQLYVALSRVRNRNGLKILLCDDGLVDPIRTENVVFTEVFDKI
ncbi:ATP-dependent DNA helicase PIF1-like [Arachis ipaensis]|uniref:ATP-dependent DNA helicase PIF1-like n=1 Tax=Arachis ipaensis TaxID=130454 RepID=UPI0007AF3C74|nr:ATP-dependent DNA helicase PIF1-like [Arachis ipaensis]XP_025685608.1 ATP-dependent DNA helicase PIF1-like [Arachis hypogaea]